MFAILHALGMFVADHQCLLIRWVEFSEPTDNQRKIDGETLGRELSNRSRDGDLWLSGAIIGVPILCRLHQPIRPDIIFGMDKTLAAAR
jgi:hypothetical protein